MTRSINRRSWMAGSISAAVALNCKYAMADDAITDLDIIDCHTHFYDPTRAEGIPWPGKGTPLYRTVLPRHLRALKHFRRVTGTVIVEASPRVEDNDWLLDIAKDDPFVVGIVGRLEPGGSDFATNLKRLTANQLFRGIRISVQLVQKLLASNDLSDLRLLADNDLALDVNGGPETPGVVAKLAARLPALRIVQNHIGNVPVTEAAPPVAWKQGIRAAAEHANVFCKISALVESVAHHTGKAPPEDLDFYRPYIDVVWNAFGDDRVIYGSNWPVSDKGSSYETLQRISLEYAFERGDLGTRKFCSLNAANAYKWVDRPGRV